MDCILYILQAKLFSYCRTFSYSCILLLNEWGFLLDETNAMVRNGRVAKDNLIVKLLKTLGSCYQHRKKVSIQTDLYDWL